MNSALRGLRPDCPAVMAVLLLISLIVTSCGGSASTSPLAVAPAPTPTAVVPKPIVLPRDEAPHDTLSEWWYYTGHLKGPEGREYGFEFVVFQGVRAGSPVGYASHFAVTDLADNSFVYEERTDRALKIQGDGQFRLSVAGWEMGGDGDEHRLQAAGAKYAIDLRLRSVKPPMLHNQIGWISFGPVGDSYYYSRSRMEVTGEMVDGGQREQVTGLAWMDHQWGDFIVVNGGGWDWYSIQLADGTDVMVTVLRDQQGNVPAIYGTVSDPLGNATDLKSADVNVDATGSWTSPHTGTTYPSGWRLRLPGQRLDLEIRPILQDQELNTRQSTGVAYWEGNVRVTGTRAGAPISGQGYVELTGYAKNP